MELADEDVIVLRSVYEAQGSVTKAKEPPLSAC